MYVCMYCIVPSVCIYEGTCYAGISIFYKQDIFISSTFLGRYLYVHNVVVQSVACVRLIFFRYYFLNNRKLFKKNKIFFFDF